MVYDRLFSFLFFIASYTYATAFVVAVVVIVAFVNVFASCVFERVVWCQLLYCCLCMINK